MTTPTKSALAVLSLATALALGYVAFWPDPEPPVPQRADVTNTVPSASPAPLRTHPTAEDEAFERRLAETFERAVRPTTTTASDTGQPLRRAPVHVVHFAEVATPLKVFRVVDHPAMTIDGMTYQPSRFAFVAIDIADTMRSEGECLFVDWQSRLTTGSCYWPATWARGKWMVIPVDTSPVVQFRRRSGANILPAMKVADLPTISTEAIK